MSGSLNFVATSAARYGARLRRSLVLHGPQADVPDLNPSARFASARLAQIIQALKSGEREPRVVPPSAATHVALIDAADVDAIVLSAGEQLTVRPHAAAKRTRADTAAATAWVEKCLMFEETPLSEVAEEFDRHKRRPLAIDDPDLQTLKISGVYSSADPASLINFLRNQNSTWVIETEDQVRVVRREAH